MRAVVNRQTQIGEIDISKIEFDPRCRDEIPKLLRGLQYIYCTPELKNAVFDALEASILSKNKQNNGRPGMSLWRIFVLACIKLNCNWDYDKLHNMSNNHRDLRLMLGHGVLDEDYSYPLQTLRDNVSLLNEDALIKINEIVVKHGHRLVKKKGEKIKAKCDSFVVETDVHYPTDINLLLDAMRKVIILSQRLCRPSE